VRFLLRLGRGLGLRREDGIFALAGEQAFELVLVDRLALDEDLRDPVQVVDVVEQHLAGDVVPFLDDPTDLVVDLAGESADAFFPPDPVEPEPAKEPERRPQVKPRPFPLPGNAMQPPPEPNAS